MGKFQGIPIMNITINIPDEAAPLVAGRLNPLEPDVETALFNYFDSIVRDNYKEAVKAQVAQRIEQEAEEQAGAVFADPSS